jgi:hypothetical protein
MKMQFLLLVYHGKGCFHQRLVQDECPVGQPDIQLAALARRTTQYYYVQPAYYLNITACTHVRFGAQIQRETYLLSSLLSPSGRLGLSI